MNFFGHRYRLRYKWWKAHKRAIFALIQGRYEVIAMGFDPGPVEEVLRQVFTKRPRPGWVALNESPVGPLLKIIATTDEWARRKHEADGGIEEG
jgi:hypothetical protein